MHEVLKKVEQFGVVPVIKIEDAQTMRFPLRRPCAKEVCPARR